MRTRSVVFSCLAAVVFLLGAAERSAAVPNLQLDIGGGFYDDTTQSVTAPAANFALFAYLNLDNNLAPNFDLSNTTFYLTAAVSPRQDAVADPGEFGTFFLVEPNGNTGNHTFAASDYGTPSAVTQASAYCEANPNDPQCKDLPSHGIYDTYFKEFAFTFPTITQAEENNFALVSYDYNVQTDTGIGPQDAQVGGSSPTRMAYKEFFFNVVDLSSDVELHFDLYALNNTTGELLGFAPWSHDAQSDGRNVIPEPSSLILFGSGLLGLARYWRRRARPGPAES